MSRNEGCRRHPGRIGPCSCGGGRPMAHMPCTGSTRPDSPPWPASAGRVAVRCTTPTTGAIRRFARILPRRRWRGERDRRYQGDCAGRCQHGYASHGNRHGISESHRWGLLNGSMGTACGPGRLDVEAFLPGRFVCGLDQTTTKLPIMAMSSCSRLWQWKTYRPGYSPKRIAIEASSAGRRSMVSFQPMS